MSVQDVQGVERMWRGRLIKGVGRRGVAQNREVRSYRRDGGDRARGWSAGVLDERGVMYCSDGEVERGER